MDQKYITADLIGYVGCKQYAALFLMLLCMPLLINVNAECQVNFLSEIPASCETNEHGKFGMMLESNSIATDSQNRIIIADTWNHRVQVFDKNGSFVKTFGCSGVAPGKFIQSGAVAVDHNDRILVADKWDRIQIFDKYGNLVDISGGTGIPWIEGNGAPCYIASLENMMKGGTYGPEFRRIAIDSSNRIIAVYYDMCNNDRYSIRIYNSDGSFVKEFGGVYATDSSIESYGNLAVDSNGNIIVAYSRTYPASGTHTYEVRVYNSSGNFIKTVPNVNSFDALNSSDYLFIKKVNGIMGDPNYSKIEGVDVYNLNGTHIKTISGDIGNSDMWMNYPIASDSENRIIIGSSNAINIFDADGKKNTTFGGRGDVTGHLNMPYGVAVDHLNRTIVADTQNQNIQIFNSDGTYNKTVRKFFNALSDCPLSQVTLCDSLKYTLDAAVDSNSRMIISDDSIYGRITILDSNGSFITAFGNKNMQDTELYSPASVDTDSQNRIIVADTFYSRVRIFDSNLNFVKNFGSQGSGNGGFNTPFGITTDEDDRIIVADTLNNRTQIFDKNGNFIRSFGSSGTGNGQFNWAWGVAAYHDLIAVSDFLNNRIQIFDRNGNFIKTFGVAGFEHSEFITPAGLEFDDYGRLHVSDTGNYRIQSFELSYCAANDLRCSKDSECESNHCYGSVCKPAGYCDTGVNCSEEQYCLNHKCENLNSCDCNSCEECTNALNNLSCNIVKLKSDILNHTSTCINDSENFDNKIFDCSGHKIDGTIANDSFGIYVNDKENNIIKNCVLTDWDIGIAVAYSSNNTLKNNSVTSNNYGIGLIYSSNNNSIVDNTANLNNGAGIYIESSSNNTLTNNHIISNNGTDGTGIYLISSFNTIVFNNFASLNDYGIRMENSFNTFLLNNNASSNKKGISMLSSSNNSLLDNIISSNNDAGIYIKQSSANYLINNTANLNGYGIFMEQLSTNNTLIRNTANLNTDGIIIDQSHSNILINNTLNLNALTGIFIVKSDGIQFLSNNINFNNDTGIYMDSSSNGILINNTIKENKEYDVWVNPGSDGDCSHIMENNTGSGDRKIKYINSSATLENQIFSELILCNADNSNINNIIIAGSDNFNNNGLFVIRTEYSNFTNINSSNNAYGIMIEHSANNNLVDNYLDSNNAGIYIEEVTPLYPTTYNNTLIHNLILNNTNGVYMYFSTNSILINNTILNNTNGIRMYFSANNIVKSNTVDLNEQSGIWLYFSSNNSIISNKVDSNKEHGIYLNSSSNVRLSENSVKYNGRYGLYMAANSNGSISWNKFCFNNQSNGSYYDIYSDNLTSNSGDNNTCNRTYNWNDNMNTVCTYSCLTCYDETLYGALYGECSTIKPKYCSNGTLVNNCSLCGCDPGLICNTTNNSCCLAPPAIKNVTAVLINSSTVNIAWDTNINATSIANYGTNASNLNETAKNYNMTTKHSITLTNLSPAIRYHFNVTSCNADGNCNTSQIYNFTTKKSIGENCTQGGECLSMNCLCGICRNETWECTEGCGCTSGSCSGYKCYYPSSGGGSGSGSSGMSSSVGGSVGVPFLQLTITTNATSQTYAGDEFMVAVKITVTNTSAAGVKVEYANSTAYTKTNGTIIFTAIEGTYAIKVSGYGYISASLPLTIIKKPAAVSSLEISVIPEPPAVNEIFAVIVTSSNSPIKDAKITYINETRYTDKDGKAQFNAVVGRNLISASKENYKSAERYVEVREIKKKELSIEAPTETIEGEEFTIKVTSYGEAVSGIAVTYNGITKKTDENGVVKFTAANQTKTLSASGEGYETATAAITKKEKTAHIQPIFNWMPIAVLLLLVTVIALIAFLFLKKKRGKKPPDN